MNVNNFNFKIGSHEEIKKLAKRAGRDIGTLRKLITTTREDLIAAINELKQEKSDITGRIEVLEELHKKPVVQEGPASEYPGTGWYKATDTGVVYNVGVPEGETHTFKGDPKEYISVYTKEDAKLYSDRAATSNMTMMNMLFSDESTFNEDISHWDTSNVTNMVGMFYGATSFNQDIGRWDTSKVTSFNSMFKGASSFNQDIGKWNTSKAVNMAKMFSEATSFNQDIGRWDTRSLIFASRMFESAISFNQDLSQWCVSRITEDLEAFDTDATTWTLPRPVWGTCPRGEDQA